jgi:Methyltransferase domain/C-methyltransferase C-terminal domain
MTKPMSDEKTGSSEAVHQSTCPACGHHVSVVFLDKQYQPLATVAWPNSEEEATSMAALPLAFVRCVSCGHVYNREFDYAQVPYSEKPNLMFNQGHIWRRHLDRTCDLLLDYLPERPRVVEVGCGEGHLLRAMAERRPAGQYIGFDPNATTNSGGLFEPRAELFIPQTHVAQLCPDVIISRHVLEHLVNPLGFLQAVGFAVSLANIESRVFIEVPCVDRVFESGRVVDFYYEHNSHFTTESFTRMLQQTSGTLEMLIHSYNREVISGLVRLGGDRKSSQFARQASEFREGARRAKVQIGRQLNELASSGRSVAIWGGTGKAAAFINYFRVDARRFPFVVDSDPNKVGTHVPGQGQKICSAKELIGNPVDTIIVPMQWRARDVLQEMQAEGITCQHVLIEHQGQLIDFQEHPHPY